LVATEKKESTFVAEKTNNRRLFGRRTAFKSAAIAQAGGQRVSATVLDISDGGARIKIARPQTIEKEFYLEIPEDDFIVKCRTAYVRETSIGATFIGSPRRLSWLKRSPK
jgi:hypothetical protein